MKILFSKFTATQRWDRARLLRRQVQLQRSESQRRRGATQAVPEGDAHAHPHLRIRQRIRLGWKWVAYRSNGVANGRQGGIVGPRYNEDLGTMKITLWYQGKKKTEKYKELGPTKLPCYKSVFIISELFITRFHCSNAMLTSSCKTVSYDPRKAFFAKKTWM